jgi:site-specific recombinase XerD
MGAALPNTRVYALDTAKQALGTCCKRLGFPQWGHHAMRHFFCSNAIEAGIDFKVIADWLGHRDGGILVAKTYGHLRAEHSAAMAQKMTFSCN